MRPHIFHADDCIPAPGTGYIASYRISNMIDETDQEEKE